MRTALLLLLLALPGAARGQVFVVDDDGGPGVDFTEIQAAIDAAASGDVVLVRNGNYAPFTLRAKGLAVVADTDQTVGVTGGLAVEDVPAGTVAVLRGISTTSATDHGLLVTGCLGAVRVEECALEGQVTPSEYEPEMTFHAALVQDSSDVAFVRSSFQGGAGTNVGFFGEPFSGADAVRVESSVLAVVDCELRGGDAASSHPEEFYGGGLGGHGLRIWDTALWLSGSHARGGHGGAGGEDFDLFVGQQCGDGGDGGSGLFVSSFPLVGGTPLPSSVTIRDLTYTTGLGGGTICGSPGDDGVSLLESEFVTHSIELLPGAARSTYGSAPVSGGGVLRIHAEGEPGDFFFLAFGGPSLAPIALSDHPLPLTVAAPFLVLPLGSVPAGGELVVPLPLGPLGPGFGGASFVLQGALLTGAGAFELAPYGTTVLTE